MPELPELDGFAFRHFAGESDPNGAVDPYTSLGYEVVSTSTTYRKPLSSVG